MRRMMPAFSRYAAALSVALAGAAMGGENDTVTFKKSLVELIDTGLENYQHISGEHAALWLDDHRLVTVVPLEKTSHDPREIGRTVIYDLRTGATREIMRYARPTCADAASGKLGMAVFPDIENMRKRKLVLQTIDQDGRILDRTNIPKGLALNCERAELLSTEAGDWARTSLHSEIGDLFEGRTKNWDALPKLRRPDGTEITLPLKSSDISDLRYLPFSGRYHLYPSGCALQGRKCPPDVKLLERSGEISTFAIPRAVLDFIPIQWWYVVRNGILFRAESRLTPNTDGYLLLRNGVLHQLWQPGRPKLFVSLDRGLFNTQRTEDWGGQSISPDGCKVAFRRGYLPSRLYVFDLCNIAE